MSNRNKRSDNYRDLIYSKKRPAQADVGEIFLNIITEKLSIKFGINNIKEILTADMLNAAVKDLFSNANLVFVDSLSDLPEPIGNYYPLKPKVAYYFLNDLDLLGKYLLGAQDTTLLGTSSETSRLTSTGLPLGQALFVSSFTTPIRHISFYNVDTCLEINGDGFPPVALDWTGVNFIDIPNVGTIKNIDNFVFDKGAFLGTNNLEFGGSINTVGFANSLFRGTGDAGNIIRVTSDAVIGRRFRAVLCPFIAFGSTNAINFDSGATIAPEKFILENCDFSGSSEEQYLPDVDASSNKSLFVQCVGIENTSVRGQMYMQGNAIATVITNTTDWVKIAGVTLPSSDNRKYLHSNNRLTCDATIQRGLDISVTLSFNSGNGNVIEFGIYDSKLGGIREPSRTTSTANASGRAEHVSLDCAFTHSQGNYIEIWCRNTSAANNVTVTSLNTLITE